MTEMHARMRVWLCQTRLHKSESLQQCIRVQSSVSSLHGKHWAL